MPLRPPALDDRRYEDLVAELVDRIRAHTPEWTHSRPGDPGRTLIELFAWLGDALLYRANLVPERQRLVFLRLLGQPLEPARPARGLVTVSLNESTPAQVVRVRPLARFNGPVTFESRREFSTVPVTAAAYVKRPAADSEVEETLRQALSEFHNGGRTIRPYVTTPLFAGGQTQPGGYDIVADTTDRSLWLALLAPKAPNGQTQEAFNQTVLGLIGPADSAQRPLVNVGFVPDLPTQDPLAPAAERAQVPHVWEITANTTGRPVTTAQPWHPEYLPLDRQLDTSGGLTRPGILRFLLPPASLIHSPTHNVREDAFAGVGDRPPRIDDEAVAARIVAWLRLRPTPPAPATTADSAAFAAPGESERFAASDSSAASTASSATEVAHLRVVWADVNAVEVEQMQTRTNVLLGDSNGAADQEFQLPATSVEPETLRIEVEEDQGWVVWRRVEDLGALDRDPQISREARAYELDSEAGTIRFGDGLRGKVPAAGQRIRLGRLRAGGGAAGNLPPRTLATVSASSLENQPVGSRLVVGQPMAFTGGTDAETLRDAERRLPARLRHRERAVTADDYRSLARETPGVPVGRVELLPRFKPQQRFFNVPGILSVMVLPNRPLAPAPNPRADRPFLEAVHAHLDARRPVGTELYVIGCEYVPVGLALSVSIAEGSDPDTTAQAVKDALRRLLWPLEPGGFDGKGWTLGRALSNRELAVEVARVPGISEVGGLNLFRRETAGGDWSAVDDSRNGREQHLTLRPWQLPELLAVVVVVEDTAAGTVPGAPLSLVTTNPYADPNAVGVPIVPDLC